MSSDDYQLNIEQSPEEQSKASKAIDLLYKIPRKVRIVACIFLFTFLVISLLNAFKPEAQKREIPEIVVRVDVIEASLSDYPIVVNTNGTIEAETRGNLVAQIRGEIVNVSDSFKTGGSFEKGDVLIQIDPRDYQADLSTALASLSQANAAYSQEQATAKQAAQDWARLGNSGAAPALVLRKPQLAAAKAQLESAKAAHETAKLNLSRTTLTAPYDGRIIQRQAVLGQYVGTGTIIAEVFATGGVEVRLPLSQEEYSQLGLDSLSTNQANNNFKVALSTSQGTKQYTWDALVTRTDSTFDLSTRQIDVIATVINPFESSDNKPPLKIGQFVNASIRGRIIENIIVVPNKAIREGSYVFISNDERLQRAPVQITWQDDQNALIESGLNPGDLVVTTSLNSTLAGAKVKLPESISSPTIEPPTQLKPVSTEPEALVVTPSGTSVVQADQATDTEIATDASSIDNRALESVATTPSQTESSNEPSTQGPVKSNNTAASQQ